MAYEFRFPDIGEGITEGELLAWKVKEGDLVAEDQTLAEMETDKAVVELPSPRAGRVARLHAAEGDIVKVGDVVVTIEEGAAAVPARTRGQRGRRRPAGPRRRRLRPSNPSRRPPRTSLRSRALYRFGGGPAGGGAGRGAGRRSRPTLLRRSRRSRAADFPPSDRRHRACDAVRPRPGPGARGGSCPHPRHRSRRSHPQAGRGGRRRSHGLRSDRARRRGDRGRSAGGGRPRRSPLPPASSRRQRHPGAAAPPSLVVRRPRPPNPRSWGRSWGASSSRTLSVR